MCLELLVGVAVHGGGKVMLAGGFGRWGLAYAGPRPITEDLCLLSLCDPFSYACATLASTIGEGWGCGVVVCARV